MGLLIFWRNTSTPNVNTDFGGKPQLVSILDFDPSIILDDAGGIADTTTTAYSNATVTYNSSTQTYGGSDRFNDIGPSIYSVLNFMIPSIGVFETNAVFQYTNTLYNSPATIYNDPNQTYGGRDLFSDTGPQVFDMFDPIPDLFKIGSN